MATKNNQNNFPVLILSVIIAFIFGAGLVYFGLPFVNPPKENKLTNDYATVQKINNLHVFIEAEPVSEYTTLKTFKGDSLESVWNSFGIGKDKFGKVLLNILDAGQHNLILSQKLERMTEAVNNQYSDADGVIFSDKMNECAVIKFK